MCRVERGVMWRVVFGGERVKGVGGTRAGRVQASRSLCFAHKLAPYCIQHPPFIMRSISVSESHSPKPNPKRHNFLKMKKVLVLYHRVGGRFIG